MLKFNRTTEYGLIALRHLSRKDSEIASAREISEQYQLPFEITAKTLLKLKDAGILQSAQGARGGYAVRRRPEEISLAEFLELMEGPLGVVNCVGSQQVTHGCDYGSKCGLSGVMSDLNGRMMQFLAGIRLSELTDSPGFQASKPTRVEFGTFAAPISAQASTGK